MVSSVVILALAAVAQAPAPAPKADTKTAEIRTAKLNEAERLLRNGRYAEAEEALAAIEAQGKKEPAGLAPAIAVALAVSRAECQVESGRIRQGDRRPSGGRGRESQECRPGRSDSPISI